MRTITTLLTLCLLMPAGASRADAGEDHELARDALARGEILPLAQVLDRVSASRGGTAIDVELETDDGRWIYELKWLRDDGSLGLVLVDARTGEVIAERFRHQDKKRRGRHR